jgi:hypothetical protein
MLSPFALALALTLSGTPTEGARAPASSTCDLCGTWLLVDRVDRTANGDVLPEPTLGADPLGILVYDRGGHVAVQLMKRVRTANGGAIAAGSPAGTNNSGAGDGYDAYFGTYEVDTSARTVTHVLQGGLAPTDVGKRLTRNYVLRGDELSLSFSTTNGGVTVTRTLRWRRA